MAIRPLRHLFRFSDWNSERKSLSIPRLFVLYFDPVLNVWDKGGSSLYIYAAGTWGAVESRQLFHHKNLRWRHSIDTLEKNE